MSCKHKWHLYKIFDNSDIKAIGDFKVGFHPKYILATKQFAEMICIKCWESEIVEVKK